MEEDFDEATMDACLIASGQRAEHYEMAAYGSAVAWAKAMGHDDAADLLQQILDQEKAADEKLSALAEGGINEEAASSAHPQDDEAAEDEDTPARPVRTAMKKAAGAGAARSSAGARGPAVRAVAKKAGRR